jgi:hypothetical protein
MIEKILIKYKYNFLYGTHLLFYFFILDNYKIFESFFDIFIYNKYFIGLNFKIGK